MNRTIGGSVAVAAILAAALACATGGARAAEPVPAPAVVAAPAAR